jgi:hypothetical protein
VAAFPDNWLLGCLHPGYLASAELVSVDVRYPRPGWHELIATGRLLPMPAAPEITVVLRSAVLAVTAGPGDAQRALEDAMRGSGVPALAALASLIGAHREEYEGLAEAEAVLKALGGGRGSAAG